MHILTLIIGVFVFVIPTVAQTPVFLDTTNHRFESSIQILKEKGIIKGYDDGTFKPDATINRAEFLAIIMRSTQPHDQTVEDTHCFADFTEEPQWYWMAVCKAKEMMWVGGYPDGTFRGVSAINTVEALKLTEVALGVELPQYVRKPDAWYAPYIDAASSWGILDRLPLSLDHSITRGEAAMIIATFVRR